MLASVRKYRLIIAAVIAVVSATIMGTLGGISNYITNNDITLDTIKNNNQALESRLNNAYKTFATKERMLKDFDYTKHDLEMLEINMQKVLIDVNTNSTILKMLQSKSCSCSLKK